MNIKKTLGKIWHFLWKEESIASYVADAILIILIGKFLLYPGLGLLLDTNYPVVAVVSDSMDHKGKDFETWWAESGNWYVNHDITKEEFLNYYKANGFDKGDIFVVKGVDFDDIKAGDVLVFRVHSRKDPIIHRVIFVGDDFVSTKGDANVAQLPFEDKILEGQIEGVASGWIPVLGWVKVGFIEILRVFGLA
jgi:hypothetical protein